MDHKGKPSGLGFASGVIVDLVAITPAAGFVGPMGAIVLGFVASPVCVIFCAGVKQALNYDDAYDVFGIHGVAGIIGAIGTGILTAPQFGGTAGWGLEEGQTYDIVAQTITQTVAVVLGVGVAAAIVCIVMTLFGLRVSKDVEQEGLDLAEHGEAAYHS